MKTLILSILPAASAFAQDKPAPDKQPAQVAASLTPEESAFVVQLLGQLTVKPADPAAAATLALIQAILAKLAPQPPKQQAPTNTPARGLQFKYESAI
jgi:hypothetical protein